MERITSDKMTVACQFFLIRLSCTHADGTDSSLGATDEGKSVQSSSMSLTGKLDGATKSAVLVSLRVKNPNHWIIKL